MGICPLLLILGAVAVLWNKGFHLAYCHAFKIHYISSLNDTVQQTNVT